MLMAAQLHQAGIRAGLALLQDTPVEWAEQIMHSFDQILIFSGHLGFQGGQADLKLLDKVKQVKSLHPKAEIAWDGGINDNNAAELASSGVDILNVGSFIQDAEKPDEAYAKIVGQLGKNNV
jgi:ribulose-phosphate 3-epimerase